MIGVTQHNCARSYECAIAVVETGVKPRVDVGYMEEPLSGRAEIGMSHSAHEIGI